MPVAVATLLAELFHNLQNYGMLHHLRTNGLSMKRNPRPLKFSTIPGQESYRLISYEFAEGLIDNKS